MLLGAIVSALPLRGDARECSNVPRANCRYASRDLGESKARGCEGHYEKMRGGGGDGL
jgi:hypothetical protein